MEPRSEEARQASPAATQMPDVGTARLALAIHGDREHFRTITVEFDTEDAFHAFGNLVRDGGVTHALLSSPGMTLKLVSR